MAKIKKGKAKGPEQSATSQQPAEARIDTRPTAVPAVVPAVVALHPSAHVAHEEETSHAGHWPAPEHDGDAHEHDDEDDWGEGAAESADVWGGPSSESEQHSVRDWGAPSGGGWGDPPSGGAWGEAPIAPGAWGLPPEPASNGLGVYGMSKGNSKRGGVPVAQSPRTTAQAPASLHPSAAVHMTPSAAVHMAPSGWGAPHAATTAWGDPTGGWGQPPVPRPPAAKPAWANWANEVKMSQPQHHRQQSVPHPNHSQQGQYAHPQVQFAAEQQSTLRRAQESHARSANGHSQPGHAQQQTRPAPQYADSWTHWGRDGWGGERTSTIPEEDEEYDEDEDGEWEEDEDDEWSPSHGNQRVRFSPNVDYAQSPSSAARARPRHPPARASVTSPPRQAYQQVWTPSPISRTMKMARGGSISSVSGTVKTTVFELVPPRNGFGENTFVDSHAEALIPADRALYSRDRPAKERFRWGFNPDKDPRVGSLLRWIAAMSNGLATIGVQRFLETRERGALFTNADYRIPTGTGNAAQPAFDWVTLSELHSTLDSTLQSSVTLYDPAFQVIVFVFLLSPSGNSMAVWRRKLDVPDTLREAHAPDILAVQAELKRNYPVYVDELPVGPEEAAPTVPKKKKVRFAFIRRMFGGRKKTDVT